VGTLTPSGGREPVRRADFTGDFERGSRAVRRAVHGWASKDHGTTDYGTTGFACRCTRTLTEEASKEGVGHLVPRISGHLKLKENSLDVT